jgi:hypothetical protein
MKHEKYKELLELNILNELSDNQQIELENHLFECEECSKEFTELKKMYSLLANESPEQLSERDLQNARLRLFNSISIESEKKAILEKVKESLNLLFNKKYSIAFGSIALVLVGFFVGYLLFQDSKISPKLISENIIDLDKIENGELQIARVDVPEVFSNTGEFEFKIGNENPISYKGTLEDEVVQRLLASAIQSSENPGFKIRTTNSIYEFMPKDFNPDIKIKDAFIHSLKTDENPGVRKEALRALINFAYDDKIRDAILFTLENDDNAANRMLAINALLAINSKTQIMNDSIKIKLKNELPKEDNEVVKLKTAKLLLGGK